MPAESRKVPIQRCLLSPHRLPDTLSHMALFQAKKMRQTTLVALENDIPRCPTIFPNQLTAVSLAKSSLPPATSGTGAESEYVSFIFEVNM